MRDEDIVDDKVVGDGGPAFPITQMVDLPRPMGDLVIKGGMSLRDWFAGMALQGYLSKHGNLSGYESEALCNSIARYCFTHAVAMLRERIKNARD